MKEEKFSNGLPLTNIQVTDPFFKQLMEVVRTEVIPYQWEALNDRVEGAVPSFCMRNFKVAGKLVKTGTEERNQPQEFNHLPESMDQLKDEFYGYLFQDTDFSKWIEAVGYSLTQHPDSELEKIADGAIDIVCAAQGEDGYLDTYYIINDPTRRFSNLKDNHEMYCMGHLIEGAIAYYEATGKDKLLKAAMRFADCVGEHFGPEEGKKKGYPGHEIAEMALVRLYKVTGEKKYLKLAEFFINQRGQRPYYFTFEKEGVFKEEEEEQYSYNQAHKPVREQDEALGHAVRAVYLYSGMADIAKEVQDEKLVEACERLWDNIVSKKMYINGGIGASPEGEAFSYNYNLPNDKMYNETCASIGLIFFARRMLEMTPKACYADVMERALYNGVISGMALDGKSFFYVNPIEVEPEGCYKDAQRKQVLLPRQKWLGCACCPPNLARLLSSIASYAYSENSDTLFMHLYMGGKLTKQVSEDTVQLQVESAYPWKDTVHITMEMEKQTAFTMALRIPGWCREAKLLVNGTEVKANIQDGYAYLNRKWKMGDTITLKLPMTPTFYQVNTRVRADIHKTALLRGPIVYCLEEADNGADLHLIEVNVGASVEVKEEQGELGNIVRLEATGRRIQQSQKAELYTELTGYTYEETKLHYIPYYTWCNRGVGEMVTYTGWYRQENR